MPNYRSVPIGTDLPDAVTVGIERHDDGKLIAAVWWPSKGDVDADEAEYADVPAALQAAQAAKELHGFSEVAVTLQNPDLWDSAWGTIVGQEPLGRIDKDLLTEDESYELAAGLEASRDA